MNDILNSIMPHLIDLLGVILAAAVTAVMVALRNYVTQRAGADAAQRLMALLHHALETGVNAAITAAPNATPQTIADAAIAHAYQSIPDTIKSLGPSVDVLTNIALSKLSRKVAS